MVLCIGDIEKVAEEKWCELSEVKNVSISLSPLNRGGIYRVSTPSNTFSRQHAPQCRPVAKIGSHKFKSKLRKIVAFDHLKRTLLCPHLRTNEICQRHNYEVTQNKKDFSMKFSSYGKIMKPRR